jgi:hypothetical protein
MPIFSSILPQETPLRAPRLPSSFDEELRHDEERDALDALGPAGDFRQHEMDDVLGHVVVARGDEDLLTRDAVGAVVLRFGLGAHQAEIGAAMGLGQVHGAGPVAGHHLGKPLGFLFVGAVRDDRRGRAVGQALVHGEGLVGGREHLAHRRVHQVGQALSAEFLGMSIAGQPFSFICSKASLKPVGRVDDAVFQAAALGVADRVQRGQNLGADLAGLFEDGGGEVAVEIGVAGDPGIGDLQDVVQNVLHVLGGGGVARHV